LYEVPHRSFQDVLRNGCTQVPAVAKPRGAVGIGLYVHVPGREPYVRTRGVANMATGEPLTPEHLFRIASMSKPYLSVLLVKLAVEGRLSLDEPITERLPAELTALVPHAQDIALHDMLTHQSGIIDYRDLVFTSEVLFGDHAKVRDEYTRPGRRAQPQPDPVRAAAVAG
jgi:D-alanyl-D-alanine carboxypeptidase